MSSVIVVVVEDLYVISLTTDGFIGELFNFFLLQPIMLSLLKLLLMNFKAGLTRQPWFFCFARFSCSI